MAAIAQQIGLRHTTVSRIVNEAGRYKAQQKTVQTPTRHQQERLTLH
jgi:DNA-binding LacI/PurR family transcriptional regulator